MGFSLVSMFFDDASFGKLINPRCTFWN